MRMTELISLSLIVVGGIVVGVVEVVMGSFGWVVVVVVVVVVFFLLFLFLLFRERTRSSSRRDNQVGREGIGYNWVDLFFGNWMSMVFCFQSECVTLLVKSLFLYEPILKDLI